MPASPRTTQRQPMASCRFAVPAFWQCRAVAHVAPRLPALEGQAACLPVGVCRQHTYLQLAELGFLLGSMYALQSSEALPDLLHARYSSRLCLRARRALLAAPQAPVLHGRGGHMAA